MDISNFVLLVSATNIFFSILVIIVLIITIVRFGKLKTEITKSIDTTNKMKSKLSDIFRLSHDIIGYIREISKSVNYRNNRRPTNNRYQDNRNDDRNNYNKPRYNNNNRPRYNDDNRTNYQDRPRYNTPKEDEYDEEKILETKNKIDNALSSRLNIEKESNSKDDYEYNVNDGDFNDDVNDGDFNDDTDEVR